MNDVKFPGIPEIKSQKRNEAIIGGLWQAVLLGSAGWAVYKILPYLITLMENLLYLGGMIGVAALVIFLITDKRIRNIAWNLYKYGIRLLTGIVIDLDMKNIIQNYIETRKKKLAEIGEGVAALAGQKRKLETLIGRRKDAAEHSLGTASAAKSKNMGLVQNTETRRAMRAEQSAATLTQTLETIKRHHALMSRVQEICEVAVQDLEESTATAMEDFEAVKTSHSVISRAAAILKGNDDDTALYNEAMERMLHQSSQMMGNIDEFMTWSTELIQKSDLETAVMDEAGLQRLAEFEQRISGMDQNQKSAPLATRRSSGAATSVASLGKYDDLLN